MKQLRNTRESPFFSENELQTLILCAVRYALGRKTYIVDDITRMLIKNPGIINDDTKAIICRDIDKAIEYNEAGMDMDKECWLHLKESLSNPLPHKDY